MHVYIYDNLLDSQKHNNLLAKIETRITDLGLNGKIIRLNPMHNIKKTILDEAKPGRTLILVGGDKLFNEALAILAYKEIPIGYIPFFPNQPLADALGIPYNTAACDVIAARRLLKIDLASANDKIFLAELSLTSVHNLVDLNNNLKIEIEGNNSIKIINLPLSNNFQGSNPFDGILELKIITKQKNNIFRKKSESLSLFSNDTFVINSNDSAVIDKCQIISAPINVNVLKNAVEVIVGKDRRF